MGSITTYINQPFILNLPSDFSDQGWSISEGEAIHDGCNAGYIVNQGLALQTGALYTITYEITQYETGFVRASLGTTNGLQRAGVGTFTENILCQGNTEFKFYSNGDLAIRLVSIHSGTPEDNAVTVAFRENGKKWLTFYDWKPEMMIKFLDEFFVFKGGRLWMQNANETRNNFFGEQFTSRLKFISNKEPMLNQVYFTVKIDGTGKWALTSIQTNKTDQFPAGMISRLKKGNIKLIDGKYWADFLGDMNDPEFMDIPTLEQRQLKALFEGRKLQGNYLTIDMECDATDEVKLVSVTVFSDEVKRNF